ncbi:MAG: hypothetical protein HY696_04885 [Deltaproteobacteria bacterium]|nr:hypothetical protein [Deltaproteobacteria bacterium]
MGWSDRAARVSGFERQPHGRSLADQDGLDLAVRRQGIARGRALAAAARRFASGVQRSGLMSQLTPLMRPALIFADKAYRSMEAVLDRLAGMVARNEWQMSSEFTAAAESAIEQCSQLRAQWSWWLSQTGFDPAETALFHLLYTSWAQIQSTARLYHVLAESEHPEQETRLVALLRSPLIQVQGSADLVALVPRARRELARALLDDLTTRAQSISWVPGGTELCFAIDAGAEPRPFGYKDELLLPSPPVPRRHPFWRVLYHFAGFDVRIVEEDDATLHVALRWRKPNEMTNCA